MEDTRLDSILSKVRGLVALAENPSTPPAEAEAARERADAMMLKYAIDQATLRESQPAEVRATPAKITVDVCEAGSPYEQMFVILVTTVCEHTRTQCVFRGAQMDADVVKIWKEAYNTPLQVTAQVYGFESDLKYFEILYTTLLLHMSNGIDPKFSKSVTDGENAYTLHNAGLNWLEIAALALKTGHEFGWDGDKASYQRCGSYWKRTYRKELRSRGEEFVHLAARRTDETRKIWRLNFANSYVATIARRLWMARSGRSAGSALVLKSSMDDITTMLTTDHPNTSTMKPGEEVPLNPTAWRAGDRHAKSADIGGQSVSARVAGQLD